jgi:hypothetical protein
MNTRTAVVGIVGFAFWALVVLGCAAGAVVIAYRSDSNSRLWWLLGCPAGVAFTWFFFRGAGRRWPIRYTTSGVVLATAVALALPKSTGMAVFIASFFAGFLGAPLVVYLREMITGT